MAINVNRRCDRCRCTLTGAKGHGWPTEDGRGLRCYNGADGREECDRRRLAIHRPTVAFEDWYAKLSVKE